MNKSLGVKAVLLLIIILAIFLRTYKMGEIPASLNPDEVALGYNAYSILKTGADEHGQFLPLSLKSFGDWKLPIYSYFATLPVALFGLSDIAVRIPSIIAGALGVYLMYCIAIALFKKRAIALIASLFFALSPWSIYFSRGAYEVNLATTIFLAGFLSLLHFLQKKKTRYLFFGLILFGITLFTQHNYIVFTPIYTFALLLLFRKSILYNRKWYASIFIFIILIAISYMSVVLGGGKKVSNLSIFNDRNVVRLKITFWNEYRTQNTQVELINSPLTI